MNQLQRIATTLLILGTLPPALAAEPIMTFAEVQAGMRGTGRTVFEGTTVESFDVEILGKLPKIGPDQDLILALCSGGPLARTGVLAGMSGSPVTIEGRLIGAIAYSWGFSKDAIAGITPIEQMLAIDAASSAGAASRVGVRALEQRDLELLRAPELLQEFFAARLRSLSSNSGAALMTAIPISISGIGAPALQRLQPELTRAGFIPLQVGGSSSAAERSVPLEPGSAIGLKLVRGDVEMTASGTVTMIDDDRVLAFGHPLFGLGAIDLPLTGAAVEALLPSLMQSTKIVTPLAELGAIRQDRSSGLLGRLGIEPKMIPVVLQFTGAAGGQRSYYFDVADDPLLAPLLLYHSLYGILAGKERPYGSSTISLRDGSVIQLADAEDVKLDNLFAGGQAFDFGSLLPAYVLHLLMNNAWAPPQIASVNLLLEYEELPRTAQIRRATLNRYSAHPGDTLTATVLLRPFRGPDLILSQEVQIPAGTPPGSVTLYIGSALSMERIDEYGDQVLPQSLDQLITLINQIRRNSRIYIIAVREDSGILLDGVKLPNLPPSVAQVISRPQERGNFRLLQRRAVFDDWIETDYSINGSAKLTLTLEER